MKKNSIPTLLSLLLPMFLASPVRGETTPVSLPRTAEPSTTPIPASDRALVQVALLLDTSGSMKGLIDQARCQLWNVVSELARSKRQESPINLEIGVYQYGSRQLRAEDGFLRQVLRFTDNLDEVSAALFSLTTGGDKEYCGQVIGAAITDLEWSENPDVYKAVFIAGNESFDQGPVSFGEVLSPINGQSIILNTIYCGTKEKADTQWRSAAGLTGGLFAKIDHNHHLPQMETPFDEEMRYLNKRMNDTFVWYGSGAGEAAKNQRAQDENAQKMSDHAFAARMSAKIGHLYHHVHHDLVDAIAHGKVDLANMPDDKMPESLVKLSPAERIKFVEEKTRQRQAVQRKMADVITSRHRWLEEKMSESLEQPADGSLVLGGALVKAIREQAQDKGYVFTN